MTVLLASVLALAATVLTLTPWARRGTFDGPPPSGAGRVARRRGAEGTARRWRPERPPGAGPVRAAGVAGVLGVAAASAAAAIIVPAPALVGAVGLGLVGRVRFVARRERRARRDLDRAGPDLVDLLVVAAAAGHPPHRCLRVVVDRAPSAVRPAVRASCRRLERGVPLAVAVDELRRGMGALGDPVADALLDAFRTGAPLQPALARVAAVARDRRRRDAEAEARRLPVLLLFPLVCCVLPAFGVLAVVPLIAASVRSLG